LIVFFIYGATSDSLKGSISQDSSTSNCQQTKHNNASLTAANINLNSTQDTLIKGANLHATNQLNINSKNLAVSSVQNKHKAKTRSQGASLGVGGSGVNSVGFHQAKSDKNSKTVLLTSITAKQVSAVKVDIGSS
jgi:filamentous hemagglutinin